jgi:hypothetical protein
MLIGVLAFSLMSPSWNKTNLDRVVKQQAVRHVAASQIELSSAAYRSVANLLPIGHKAYAVSA